MSLLKLFQEDVIVENMDKIYNTFNVELADLMIGHALNDDRIQFILDLIAHDICKQEDILELQENYL